VTLGSGSIAPLAAPLRRRAEYALAQLRQYRTAAFPLILAAITGLGAGLGAVVFRKLITGFNRLFFDVIGEATASLGPSHVIILPIIGGLLVGPIVYFFAREAKGHGVPEVMLAIARQGGRIRFRVAVVKALASSICIGSGGSVGREGPIVQIGSALASALGQRLRLNEDMIRLMVASGAAGGISATFNAPIAGVFFAMEIILRRFTARNFSVVVLSSVVANVVSLPILGDKPAFAVPEYRLESPWEMPLYALLGIICALAALTFVWLLYKAEDTFSALPLPEYALPAFGGLGVGALGLWYSDLFGVGYDGIATAIHGDRAFAVLVSLAGLKLLATSLTLGSGGSGGVFAPSLFIGAMVGGAFGEGVHGAFPDVTAASGAYALVGMGAVFSGAARAPITSIIILFEMTRDYSIILPLMTAVVVSTVVAQLVNRENIYTIKLIRRGVDVQREERRYLMETATVADAMERRPLTVPANMSLLDLAEFFIESGGMGAPVVDDNGRVVAMVSTADLQAYLNHMDEGLRVIDIATKEVDSVHPDESLHEVISRPDAWQRHQFPVVAREDRGRLLGVLRRSDIVRAYSLAASRRAEAEQRVRMASMIQDEDTRLLGVEIAPDSALVGKDLQSLSLPSTSIIVSIRRRGRTVIPRGRVILRPGDRLTVLALASAEQEVRESLHAS
jgi:CIC family chloride channel protein